MTDQPVEGVALAHGSISTTPTWTTLIVPSAAGGGTRWGFLHIENTTNVRVEISFDASTVHATIDAGESREWNVLTATVSGTVSVRKAGASASGDVTADGLV